ncbi:MAG: DUF983 domain-containing protein [Acidimicrobiia bacterium]
MSRDPSAGTITMIGRALRRRCPRCGAKAFQSYFSLNEDCTSCGLHFEREEGYWVGALIINTTITFGTFIVIFVGGILITWPDVPWALLMGLTVGINLILPIVFYPQSKTIWNALEMSWHPLEDEEIREASRRVGSR